MFDGHAEQLGLPAASAKVPAAHGVHVALPVVPAYEPGAHGVHDGASPPAEYCPCAHGRQLPPLRNWPALHDVITGVLQAGPLKPAKHTQVPSACAVPWPPHVRALLY